MPIAPPDTARISRTAVSRSVVQTLLMRSVLVSLPSGAGVVRAEHGLLVTDDVENGGGAYLRDSDLFILSSRR